MNIIPCSKLYRTELFKSFKVLESNFIFSSEVREKKYNSFIDSQLFVNEVTGESFKLEAKYFDKMDEYNQFSLALPRQSLPVFLVLPYHMHLPS